MNNATNNNATVNSGRAIINVQGISAILKGRLTGEVEIETTSNGNEVANVRIAINKAYRTKDGRIQKTTTFQTVKVWNSVANALQNNARKGDLVKFKVHGKPNSYLSEKRQEVVNEMVYTANRFRVERLARANQPTGYTRDQRVQKPTTPLNQ